MEVYIVTSRYFEVGGGVVVKGVFTSYELALYCALMNIHDDDDGRSMLEYLLETRDKDYDEVPSWNEEKGFQDHWSLFSNEEKVQFIGDNIRSGVFKVYDENRDNITYSIARHVVVNCV